jgi:hypothetical protein
VLDNIMNIMILVDRRKTSACKDASQ